MLFKLKMQFDYFRFKQLNKLLTHWEMVKKVKRESDLKLIVRYFQGYQSDDYKTTAINLITDLVWLENCLSNKVKIQYGNNHFIKGALERRIYTLKQSHILKAA